MQPSAKRDGVLQNNCSGAPVAKNLPPINACEKSGADKPKKKTNVARLGEELAARWLIDAGYKIIETNWRNGRYSEIDIVALDRDGLLTFIEVKTRKLDVDRMGRLAGKTLPTNFPEDFEARYQAFETLNWRKRQKVINAALSYIAINNIADPSCQLDAIIVVFNEIIHTGETMELTGATVFHVPRAFSDL
jgi:Holliday junction resolvase-like predicted endonuclease